MFKNIRERIREEAKADEKDLKGFIKVSFFPYGADEEVIYEFSCSLDSKKEMETNVISCFETYNIKKRVLYGKNVTEGLTDCVYVFKDFMEITVRVGGAGDDNRVLAGVAQEAISKSLEGRNDDHFSIELS
jgi:hypothetical protein